MLGDLDLKRGMLADAEKALRNLAPRAFRRPVGDDDIAPYLALVRASLEDNIAPYLALVRASLEDNKPFGEALREGIKGILCAPDFLFRREPQGALDDYALASRLSYFLWNTLPDDELFALARRNRLHDPQVLHDQVERLLNDARAERFVANFTGQWLGLRNIEFTTPDKRVYPEFDDALLDAMAKETRLFFSELLAHDLSVTKLRALGLFDFELATRRTLSNRRGARAGVSQSRAAPGRASWRRSLSSRHFEGHRQWHDDLARDPRKLGVAEHRGQTGEASSAQCPRARA
jgi:hypothetical protein